MACTCGNHESHIVSRRRSADGLDLCLWSDGMVTGALGFRIRGIPCRRPRTNQAQDLALKAGRLFLGEACIFDRDELPALYQAAEKAARLDGLPGTVRRLVRQAQEPKGPALSWAVLHSDRDGKPTERVCHLPRLAWPGMVVFDFCGHVHSSRGRYRLFSERGGACHDTGFAFRNLAELQAHLRETSCL